MTPPGTRARRDAAGWYWAGLAAVAALGLALIPHLVEFARWSGAALSFPYGIDYGEGIVWEQARMLPEGRGYGVITGLPAIVYHYPPLYHLCALLTAWLTGLDLLLAGRVLSLVSTLATAALIAVITRMLAGRSPNPAAGWLCAALAGMFFLQFYIVAYWGSLMRVDPLAVLLTMAGLLCGLTSVTRPRLIYLAGALFVAAAFTKQTSIVAPVAVFGTLLFVRTGTAVRGAIFSLVLGLAALAVAMALTEGRFLTHVVGYNVNRFGWSALRTNLHIVRTQLDLPALCVAAAEGLAVLFALSRRATWRADSVHAARRAMLLAFLALKTLSLVMMAKSGASTNYLIDWLAPAAVALGMALHHCLALLAADDRARGAARPVALAIPLALLAALFLVRPVPPPSISEQRRSDAPRLVKAFAGCAGAVIGDDMVAIIRADKRVIWEPAIFAELAAMRRYDERPLVDAIAAGRICAVGMERDGTLVAARYTPTVLAAIQRALPRQTRIGDYTLYTRDRPAAAAR